MTPLAWIVTGWLIGTIAAFWHLVHDWETSDGYKDYLDEAGHLLPEKVVKLMFYVVGFIDSFFTWPWVLFKIALRWVRLWLTIWMLQIILKRVEAKDMKGSQMFTGLLKKMYGKKKEDKSGS